MATSQTQRSEHAHAASANERTVGHDSTAVLEVEADAEASDGMTAPPEAHADKAAELQVRLDGRASVAPPTTRHVARLEDVLTIGPKRVEPRVSVPPPAPREVARLEDVLKLRPDEDAAPIAPKTVAAATHAEPVADAVPVAEAPAPVVEPKPAVTPAPRATEHRYVPAYALRAAFWFEQASAFEAGTDEEEDDDVVVPEAEQVQLPAEVTQMVTEAMSAETPVETPRKTWMVALCLLAVAGLVYALTGRRPCRCGCHGK